MIILKQKRGLRDQLELRKGFEDYDDPLSPVSISTLVGSLRTQSDTAPRDLREWSGEVKVIQSFVNTTLKMRD